jgi:integrase
VETAGGFALVARLETPRGRKDIDALTEPQIRDLAQLAERTAGDYGGEMAAIVLTLAYTGMRPGELCALRRADVDLSKREVVVRASLDGTGKEKAPKNGRTRIIALPPAAAQAVNDLPERVDSPYVFHSARGHRLSKGSLSYAWRPIAAAWREKSGRDLDLYELRHACATLLLERGLTPSDVATQLGHTDGGRLVQTLYGHPSEDAARDRLRMAFAGQDARPVAGPTHDRARSFPQGP